MKTIRVHMSERVLYALDVEVEDDATDEDIAIAAEETFVQGHYDTVGQHSRQMDGWEEADKL